MPTAPRKPRCFECARTWRWKDWPLRTKASAGFFDYCPVHQAEADLAAREAREARARMRADEEADLAAGAYDQWLRRPPEAPGHVFDPDEGVALNPGRDEDLRDLERRARAGDREALLELEERATAELGPRRAGAPRRVRLEGPMSQAPSGGMFVEIGPRAGGVILNVSDDPDGPGLDADAPDGLPDLLRGTVSYVVEWPGFEMRRIGSPDFRHARPGEFEFDGRRRGWTLPEARRRIVESITAALEDWIGTGDEHARPRVGRLDQYEGRRQILLTIEASRAAEEAAALSSARKASDEAEAKLLATLERELEYGGSPLDAPRGEPPARRMPHVREHGWDVLFEQAEFRGREMVRVVAACDAPSGRDLHNNYQPQEWAENPSMEGLLEVVEARLGALSSVPAGEVMIGPNSAEPRGGVAWMLDPERFPNVAALAEELRRWHPAGGWLFTFEEPPGVVDLWVMVTPTPEPQWPRRPGAPAPNIAHEAVNEFRARGFHADHWSVRGGLGAAGLGPHELGRPGLSLWVTESSSGRQGAQAVLAIGWEPPATEADARVLMEAGTNGDLYEVEDAACVFEGAFVRVMEYALNAAGIARRGRP